MVTFLPHLRYNSPRLNDLAIRSNEYLTSKRFLLTTARSVVCFLVLSRTSLFYSSRGSSPNPRRLILLQTLLHSQKSQLLCNQENPNSFGKIPVSPNSVPLCRRLPRLGRGGNPDLPSLAKGFKSAEAATLTTFRINTCKSVSKQSTLTTFRMNTYKKRGEGGLAGLHPAFTPRLFAKEVTRHSSLPL
jgi:hypothetical protein